MKLWSTHATCDVNYFTKAYYTLASATHECYNNNENT